VFVLQGDAVDEAEEVSVHFAQANQVLEVELSGQVPEHSSAWDDLRPLVE